VAFVRIRIAANRLNDVVLKINDVIGSPPTVSGASYQWELETLLGHRKPNLILELHRDESETTAGIYELGIFVEEDQPNRTVETPYGMLVWVKV